MKNDYKFIISILSVFIPELAKLRTNNGTKYALKYLFDSVNDKTAKVNVAIVRILKNLIYNLAIYHEEITIDGKIISTLARPGQSYESYLTEEILKDNKDAGEISLFITPIVLGVPLNICKVDPNDNTVTFY